MKKTTFAWVALFLTAYAVIVTIVIRGTAIGIEAKILLIVGHVIAYITIVYTEIARFREHFGSAEQWLRTLSNVGKAGKKREIYTAMGNAVNYLSRYAYLTYFTHRAPLEARNVGEAAYHEQLRKSIETRPDTTFRRIIALLDSDTPAKRQWVAKELELSRGRDNYSIGFVVASSQLQLPLNVQIFDDFVFLIDPSRSDEDTLARDIHFLSPDIAAIWFRYYREIWDQKCDSKVPAGYFQASPSSDGSVERPSAP